MRILTALTALGDDPYAPGLDVKKLSGHHDLFRLHVGRYRVAYRVDNGVLVILVVKIGWRKDVYRGCSRRSRSAEGFRRRPTSCRCGAYSAPMMKASSWARAMSSASCCGGDFIR